MSDLDSYVGATKGHNTAASSESGFDPKDPDADGGIPPPRTRKSHARKVCRLILNCLDLVAEIGPWKGTHREG